MSIYNYEFKKIESKIMLNRRETAENILVVSVLNDVISKAISDYYVLKRNIPASNVLEVPYSSGNLSQSNATLLVIKNKVATLPKIRCILLCGDFPKDLISGFNFDDGVKSVNHMPDSGYDANSNNVGIFRKSDNMISLAYKDIDPYYLSRLSNIPFSIDKNFTVDYSDRKPKPWMKEFTPGATFNVGDIVYKRNSYSGYITYLNIITPGTINSDTSTDSLDKANLEYRIGASIPGGGALGYRVDEVFFGFNSGVVEDSDLILNNVTLPDTNILNPCDVKYLPGLNQRQVLPEDFYYTCIRLAADKVSVNDPDNVDELSLVKRIIDDSIEVENQNLTNLPGKVVVGTTYTDYASGLPILSDCLEKFPDAEYIYNMSGSNEPTLTKNFYKLPNPLDKYQAGQNSLVPPVDINGTKTYVPMLNVFLHSLGNESYFNTTRRPYSKSDITYSKGAICMFGQSCGMGRGTVYNIDPFYSIQTGIDLSLNTYYANGPVELKPVDGNGNPLPGPPLFKFKSDKNNNAGVFLIEYKGNILSNPAIDVVDSNTIVLYDGTTSVGTINIPVNFVFIDLFNLTLPQDWYFNFKCNGAESRGMTALKQGACVVSGSSIEPYTTNGTSSAGWMIALLNGLNLSEAMRHANFGGAGISTKEHSVNNMTIGDPLYRPFHRLYTSEEVVNNTNPPLTVPIVLGTFNPGNGKIGVFYSYDVTPLFSGPAATSYGITGTLPTGLTFNNLTGVLEGTPTASGSFTSLSVNASNAAGTSNNSNTATLTIAALQPPVLVGNLAFPAATEGSPYSYDITGLFTGNVTAYTLNGSLSTSGIVFENGIFSSASVVGSVDLTNLSIYASNDDGDSSVSNTDSLIINAISTSTTVNATGSTVTEGKDVILEKIFNLDKTNMTGIRLGLFTNFAGLTESSVLSDIIPFTGNGYAPIPLNPVNFTVSSLGPGLGSVATYPKIDFVSDGSWTGVTGMYIYTDQGVLLHFAYSGISIDGSVGVTASIEVSSGVNGIVTDEGSKVILDYVYKDDNVDYNGHVMGLHQNSNLISTSVFADISPVTTGGYIVKNTSDGLWTISNGESLRNPETFSAVGANYEPLYGYDLVSFSLTSTTLLFVDDYNLAPFTLLDGDRYIVDLSV